MDDPRAKDVRKEWETADSDRGTWKNHWQQITDLCLPERNDYFTQRTPGMKRNQQVYDATPVFALIQFANGLHSLLTSPTLRWFALRCDDERLDAQQSVRAWWDAVAQEMYSYFNGPRHNFASQSHELYLDIGSIGTAVMAELESERSGILFTTRNLKECVIFENEEDRVDKLIRRWKWTTKQAVQNWGNLVGEDIWKAHTDGKDDKPWHFLHRVQPRLERNPARGGESKHKPFESLYCTEESGHVIAEGGFDEFPYHVPRLAKATNEVYGRGPGMTALPTMKMLNELMKMIVKSAQKVVDPPLQVPDDGFLLPIKTVPGSQNYFRANSPATARITPIETRARLDVGDVLLNDTRAFINRCFYVEWMTMPTADPNDLAGAGKGVTATWVLQQRDDRMRLLSPLLSRLQAEFLGPLIERTFSILWRKSVRMKFGDGSPFPPPPDAIRGRPWHAEYVSPIAIAQRSSEMDSVGRLIQLQMTLKTLNPNATDVIDHEAIMRLAAIDLHSPALALKSPAALQQEQAVKAQAEATLNASEAAKNMGGAFKDAGQGTAAFAEAAA